MNFDLKKLNKVHFFLNNRPSKQVLMAQVPAVGDVVRLDEGKYGRVCEIAWCLDEPDSHFTRANVALKELEE